MTLTPPKMRGIDIALEIKNCNPHPRPAVVAQISRNTLLPPPITPSTNYYGPHVTKSDYDQAFSEARSWVLESEDHRPIAAARIFHVKEYALAKAVLRSKNKVRNEAGLHYKWGGIIRF